MVILYVFYINSLWPCDAICRHRSGLTQVQVVVCRLTAPSHCRNQCWLFISEVLWHSRASDFTASAWAPRLLFCKNVNYTYIYIYIYIYIYTYILYICMCVYICIHPPPPPTHTHTHTHTHLNMKNIVCVNWFYVMYCCNFFSLQDWTTGAFLGAIPHIHYIYIYISPALGGIK